MFYIQSLNQQDKISLDTALKKPSINKVDSSQAIAGVEFKYDQEQELGDSLIKHQATPASQAYQGVEAISEDKLVLYAYQIMNRSVITCSPEVSISESLSIFKSNSFHHLPITTKEGKVVGMLSDKDIYKYLALQTDKQEKEDRSVGEIMKTPVITATLKTDIRYIARLFIARHIGAMPVVEEGKLQGILTKSDILQAVIKHYDLELWA